MKLFNQVKANRPKRTPFNLSHDRKFSTQFGQLTPILAEEIVPGDTWNIDTELMVRLAPMLAPIMHRINATVHYFYVPNRIIWDGWEDFITGEKADLPPMVSLTEMEKGQLGDYLGVPPGVWSTTALKISQLPFRAYWKIVNEFYRDQNLQDEIDIENLQDLDYKTLFQRAWMKDYFTSCLPFAQKGDPVNAPLTVNPAYRPYTEAFRTDGSQNDTGPLRSTDGIVTLNTDGTGQMRLENLMNTVQGSMDINDFRLAHRVQRWLERQARSGSRYIETLLSHYGLAPNDARLQRPEFLGGKVVPISVGTVHSKDGNQSAQEGDLNQPLGTMAGTGLGVGRTGSIRSKFTEHGWIMGFVSIMPITAYQQGIHRKYLRDDKFKYFWPEFANLGEQPVFNKELILADDPALWEDTFGYQSIFSEYKYLNSSVHGDFHDNMDFWHAGRKFDPASPPALNEEFIRCDADEVNRIFAVVGQPDETQFTNHNLWCHTYNKITAVRPMPYYGTPTI